MFKTAVVLSGGIGSRLRPYTTVLPKPLMPIGDYPILEVVIRQLANQGFSRIVLAVNHQAEIIKAYFQDGKKWGVRIEYSLESKPLGTMGPLKLISDLPDDFIVMNGDILSDIRFDELLDRHQKKNSIFTIASKLREHKIDYGVLETDGENLLSIKEKPINQYLVSMGIYVANKRILDFIPNNSAYGFDNLMLRLLDERIKVSVNKFEGYWLDIGRPDDYMVAIDEFDKMKKIFIK